MVRLCVLILAISSFTSAGFSQIRTESPSAGEARSELKKFYDAYADDLRKHRREAVADRYDREGVWMLGNGMKRHSSFDDTRKYYVEKWSGPKKFEFHDLSYEVIDGDSAVVNGRFDWLGERDDKPAKCSYTGLLSRKAGRWLIRVEHESCVP